MQLTQTTHKSDTTKKIWLLGAATAYAIFSLACFDDGDNNGGNGGGGNMTNTGTSTSTSTGTSTGTGMVTNTTKPDACLTDADINGGKALEEGEYCVERTLRLTMGVLEVQPGVTLTFESGAGLQVSGEGRLKAVGSAEKGIVFKGATDVLGAWVGINFAASKGPDNQFDYVTIQGGGGDAWTGSPLSTGGIYINGEVNSLKMSNMTFSKNKFAAINITDAAADISLTSSAFNENDEPIRLPANLVGGLGEDLTFMGNSESHVRLNPINQADVISVAQTWPTLPVPYFVDQALRVREKLTLSPGTTIVFDQDKGLDVSGEGRLTAVGTMDARITLTGADQVRGFWQGVRFLDSKSTDNKFDFVTVEYGGSTGWTGAETSRGGVYMQNEGTALTVTNSLFKENAYAAISALGGETVLNVSDTAFENNEQPFEINSNVVNKLGTGLTFTGNTNEFIAIRAGSTRSTVVEDATWLKHPVPYRVEMALNVTNSLTLSPGTIIEFTQELGLSIDGGKLIADATGADPIKFVAAEPNALPGYWRGIRFNNSFESANKLANVEINSGGSDGWNGSNRSIAGIYMAGKSFVSLDTVTISKSGRYAISIDAESEVATPGPVNFVETKGDGDASTPDDVFGDGSYGGGI